MITYYEEIVNGVSFCIIEGSSKDYILYKSEYDNEETKYLKLVAKIIRKMEKKVSINNLCNESVNWLSFEKMVFNIMRHRYIRGEIKGTNIAYLRKCNVNITDTLNNSLMVEELGVSKKYIKSLIKELVFTGKINDDEYINFFDDNITKISNMIKKVYDFEPIYEPTENSSKNEIVMNTENDTNEKNSRGYTLDSHGHAEFSTYDSVAAAGYTLNYWSKDTTKKKLKMNEYPVHILYGEGSGHYTLEGINEDGM